MANDDPKQPYKPEPHSEKGVEYVTLTGNVMGYTNGEYTRPLHPTLVRLKIQIQPPDKKEEIYDPHDKKDLMLLSEKYPDVYKEVMKHKNSFDPQRSDDGHFELKDVPAGWWCYIAVAQVYKNEYEHRDELGNNGFGSLEAIHGDKLREKKGTLEDIVIPVNDEWLPKIPKVKVKDRIKPPTKKEAEEMKMDTFEK